MYNIACLLIFLSTAVVLESSKILVISGHSARSHFNVLVPIIEELASRKHDITVQAYYALEKPFPNVKELRITQGSLADSAALKEFFLNSLHYGPIAEIKTFAPSRAGNCEDYLRDETSKALVSAGQQFDVVLVDAFLADCPTAVASLVGKYIINVYTGASFSWQETHVPTPPSYVPHQSSFLPSRMTFWERFDNAINIVGARWIYQHYIQRRNQKIISAILPKAETIEEIEKKIVFSLSNGDPVVVPPSPTMPNYIHCGGMHCRKANPLPEDLNDFVESSGKEGFIIFGLGSNVKADYLSAELVQNIVSAFSRLKVKVVWKFENKLENIPKNVKTVKWMPQQDLLGHPKVRLFITHSGLLSLQETIYHGVPILGIPFFGDQRGNIVRMKELGIGEYFSFLNITADGFYEAITKMLSDKSYHDNMKKYSAIFKDQPERPVDRAVFWIEYIIRHNGARHFRSAGEDLNFFQYFLLDVAAFVLAVSLTAVGVVAILCKIILKKICGGKCRKDHDKKNK